MEACQHDWPVTGPRAAPLTYYVLCWLGCVLQGTTRPRIAFDRSRKERDKGYPSCWHFKACSTEALGGMESHNFFCWTTHTAGSKLSDVPLALLDCRGPHNLLRGPPMYLHSCRGGTSLLCLPRKTREPCLHIQVVLGLGLRF